MVTGVPGEGGCSRSSCPPEHPPQALEPKLMPTQQPKPSHLPALGPAGAVMNTPLC